MEEIAVTLEEAAARWTRPSSQADLRLDHMLGTMLLSDMAVSRGHTDILGLAMKCTLCTTSRLIPNYDTL